MSKQNIDDIFRTPIYISIYHRVPWLIIGLLGGVMAAKIVEFFEGTLQSNLYIAAFIPLIVYMSDAVGTQMEAFAIRDMAIQNHFQFIKYFLRQLIVVTLIGIILSILLFVINILIGHELRIGWVLSLSLFAAIMSSLVTGLLIPYLFNKIKLDPANASGPIATIIQDLFSVTIYFMIASILLG